MDTKTCTKCGETKALDAFGKHPHGKDGHASQCKECKKEQRRIRVAKDPEKYTAKHAAWIKANREACTENANEWRRANKEKAAASVKKCKDKKPEEVAATKAKWQQENRDKCNASLSKWKKAHPEKSAADAMKRYAKKTSATPAWANDFFISEAYDLAKRRTDATGFKWHVDHIVPLRSKKVCGLHVEFNLRVIPAVVNQKKGNRHWPDMPEQGVQHGHATA